jgi:hypothetical protein
MALIPDVAVVAPGELITADHLNDIRANLVVHDASIRKTRHASASVTTSGGVATVLFASPFESIPTVVVCNGDDGAPIAISIWAPSTVTAAGFQITARRLDTGALYDNPVRCNYIATVQEQS